MHTPVFTLKKDNIDTETEDAREVLPASKRSTMLVASPDELEEESTQWLQIGLEDLAGYAESHLALPILLKEDVSCIVPEVKHEDTVRNVTIETDSRDIIGVICYALQSSLKVKHNKIHDQKKYAVSLNRKEMIALCEGLDALQMLSANFRSHVFNTLLCHEEITVNDVSIVFFLASIGEMDEDPQSKLGVCICAPNDRIQLSYDGAVIDGDINYVHIIELAKKNIRDEHLSGCCQLIINIDEFIEINRKLAMEEEELIKWQSRVSRLRDQLEFQVDQCYPDMSLMRVTSEQITGGVILTCILASCFQSELLKMKMIVSEISIREDDNETKCHIEASRSSYQPTTYLLTISSMPYTVARIVCLRLENLSNEQSSCNFGFSALLKK